MTQTIVQVDAFSDRPFGGNPAAVCVLAAAADVAWMQAIAAEMNLSETAFLYPHGEGGYHLRWFTPSTEVDLCGHATLASAHVLWQEGHLPLDQAAQFHTRSGVLTAEQVGDWITLNFPSQPVAEIAAEPVLLKALRGQVPSFVGRTTAGLEGNYLVELASADHVRSLQPDFPLLATLPAMGVIVTAPAAAPTDGATPVDFVSRYFAPAVGINEDPVTGSAHCALAPYWQQKLSKDALVADQVSARGGRLKVRCQGDRVFISGQAVTVMRGELI
jgi:PhzF family phenazine biosynthesis protein